MSQGNGFFAEFKKFVLRGNVMDMAVGVIIGGAFTAIVTSLNNDLLSPILGLFGGTDFSNLFILLSKTDQTFASVAEAREAGAAVFAYGSFITAVINFLITALVIFLLVKAVNKMMSAGKKEEAPKAPTTKKCPFCKTEIALDATRCPNCTSVLEDTQA